jgi:hypothetical protein
MPPLTASSGDQASDFVAADDPLELLDATLDSSDFGDRFEREADRNTERRRA